MDLGLTGRVAMVTGGSRGLGKQIAQTLAREGCRLSICARSQDNLDETLAELRSQGHKAEGTVADVTDPEDGARFYKDTLNTLGNPDILINMQFPKGLGFILTGIP